MSQRIPEDEIEYRHYLYRLKKREERRRKVILARVVTLLVLILLLVLVTVMIRAGIRAVTGIKGGNNGKQTEATAEPKETMPEFSIPDGYEEVSQKLLALREEHPQVESILLNLYAYPEDVLNLVATNQETLDFAVNYPRHKLDAEASGELTQEELDTGIPRLQQWDERWGYVAYGENMIAIDGCGPTCLSMVCAGLLQDASMSPDKISEFSIDNNYYSSELGSSWSLLSTGAQTLGLKVHSINISEKDIRKQLKKGHPVICSMKPGDFTTTGHFIVLTGLTDEGKIVLNDPNSIARSNQEWEMESVLEQVKAIWAYSVP